MDIKFLEPAEIEYYEAIIYYNLQRKGLGSEFIVEVKKTIERIEENPEAWAPLSKRTRRCQTQRFPYGIIYQIRGNTLLIIEAHLCSSAVIRVLAQIQIQPWMCISKINVVSFFLL